MWTLLAILGWLLLAILLLVIVVFFTPIHLRVKLESDPAEFLFELRLFSSRLPRLFRIRGDLPAKGSVSKEPEARGKAAPAKKKRRKARRRLPFSARKLIREIPTLLRDTLARIHVDRLRLDATIGLGDPAATGELYGMLCPAIYAIPSERIEIDVTPDFAERRFQGRGEAALHFTPARLAWPTLRTGLHLFVWPR